MTCIAILSDLHNNYDGLLQVLADAERRRAERFFFLGDAGNDERILAELERRAIDCTYGNWEVSGLRRLPRRVADWVSIWPAIYCVGQAAFSHATPDVPPALYNTEETARRLRPGTPWNRLFPRLLNNEEARWRAFAAMDEADIRVAFHGHTHVQLAWCWVSDGHGRRQLRSITGPATFTLEAGDPRRPNRYLVGIGSAGQPDDGPQLRYALYDDENNTVELRRL